MIINEQIPSRLDLIPVFIRVFLKKIEYLSLGHDDIFGIKLALEEALVNAIKHGNKMNPAIAVEFRADIQDSKLTLQVSDQGSGFNFKSIPDPTAQDRLEKTSGRGVFLIKKLMDGVDFSDGGRTIKMIKFIGKGESSEDNPGKSQ
jgi:serine/threonine-protein kinase RsbW